MEYLNIIYTPRRVEPGEDIQVRWDINAPDLKYWMSLRDMQIYLDAIHLTGVGSGMGSVPISVGSAHINPHNGSLTFMLPETVSPGNYELTFSITLRSPLKQRHEICVPKSPLEIEVWDSGGGETKKRAKVTSVEPDRYSVSQLIAKQAARFELFGENLDLITGMGGVLAGRGTSNHRIPLFIIERSPDLIKLSGTLKYQTLSWLMPGPAHIVLKSDQGQLNVQVYIY
jgi:hypothetical protein